MIRLSKRLELISTFINKDDNVLDIGCDHALLDIFLSKKYNKMYFASDLRESAINMAKQNIEKYRPNNVVLLCGNGLDVLSSCDNVDTIVISGMGYMTITHILKNIKSKKEIRKVIIQSNSNPEIVRKFMLKNHFCIDKEQIVLDNNIYYVVTSYVRGRKKYSKIEKELGTIDSIEFKKYLKLELKKEGILLKVVPKKYFMKRFLIRRKIRNIKKRIQN